MIVEIVVDYLQFSMHEQEIKFMRVANRIPPVANYKRGYLQPDGSRIYYGHWNSPRGLFILSGSALHNMRMNGVEIEPYLKSILSRDARVSRLDICLTQFVDSELYIPLDYVKLIADKKIISKHAKHGAKFIASVGEDYRDNVETIYIGDMSKRASDGIARIYDKGLELDLGKYMMTRVENEEKRENAHASAKRIANGYTVAEVLKSRLDFQDEIWQEMINSKSIDMSRGKQISPTADKCLKYAKKWAWLIENVAPVVADAINHDMSLDDYPNNLELFNSAIESAYSKIKETEILAKEKIENSEIDFIVRKATDE